MNKVTLKIDGMACPMCESHIADAIRKTYSEAKEVRASLINTMTKIRQCYYQMLMKMI